jgi:hypothetical protein
MSNDLVEFDGLVQIKRVDVMARKADGHRFRKFSGVAKVDGVSAAVSFGDEDTELLTQDGQIVSAPNVYAFPQTKLAPRLDDADEHETIPGTDILCYALVDDSLLTPSPVQKGKRRAAMPVIDHTAETAETAEEAAVETE